MEDTSKITWHFSVHYKTLWCPHRHARDLMCQYSYEPTHPDESTLKIHPFKCVFVHDEEVPPELKEKANATFGTFDPKQFNTGTRAASPFHISAAAAVSSAAYDARPLRNHRRASGRSPRHAAVDNCGTIDAGGARRARCRQEGVHPLAEYVLCRVCLTASYRLPRSTPRRLNRAHTDAVAFAD